MFIYIYPSLYVEKAVHSYTHTCKQAAFVFVKAFVYKYIHINIREVIYVYTHIYI